MHLNIRVNSKHIYRDVCGTTLVLEQMSRGQESSLPYLLRTREGQRPLALTPYAVPRQHLGWKCLCVLATWEGGVFLGCN